MLLAKLVNNTVLPAKNARKMRPITKMEEQKFIMIHRTMEKSMLRISLHKRIKSKVSEERSRVKDLIAEY